MTKINECLTSFLASFGSFHENIKETNRHIIFKKKNQILTRMFSLNQSQITILTFTVLFAAHLRQSIENHWFCFGTFKKITFMYTLCNLPQLDNSCISKRYFLKTIDSIDSLVI